MVRRNTRHDCFRITTDFINFVHFVPLACVCVRARHLVTRLSRIPLVPKNPVKIKIFSYKIITSTAINTERNTNHINI